MPLINKTLRSSLFRIHSLVFIVVLALIVTLFVTICLNDFALAIQAGKMKSAISEESISLDRNSELIHWRNDEHPIAEPVLFGRVHPIVWGLLILLATLYFALALTDKWETDETTELSLDESQQ